MPPKSPRKKANPKARARGKPKVNHPIVISRPRTIACFRRRHNEASNPKPLVSQAKKQKDKNNVTESEEEYVQTNFYLYLRMPPRFLSTLSPPNPLPLPPPHPPGPSASTFHDETTPFSIPASFTPSSGPLDKNAIFPPGVPMSASEILAFYPQHLSWPAVSHRLSRNGFSAKDVHGIESTFRDDVPDVLRWEVGITGKGKKAVKDMSTSAWIHPSGPAKTVPSFSQLLQGVNRVPTGIGRRHLTTALEWYASTQYTFTPPLDLNVLHARPLIQALRLPLRRYGPQNVDASVLSLYRHGGRDAIASSFSIPLPSASTSLPLSLSSSLSCSNMGDTKREEKSRITLNVPKQTVKVEVLLRVGTVLLMPYFGVGGLFCEALEWGIGRAEERRRGRLGEGRSEGGGGGDEGSKADDEVVRREDVGAGGVPRRFMGTGKRARDEDDKREARVGGAPWGGTIG